jgi:CRISPR-associated protein Cmr4
MYKNKAYLIKTKTNLHVGSDGTNFGIVDKQVQRDTITNLPVINASSLKGALRDHYNEEIQKDDTSKHFIKLFGDEDTQGLIKFVDAKLLFLPLRSNKKPYYHVTSKSNLQEMEDFLESMNINIAFDQIKETNKSVVIGDEKNVVVEDVECDSVQIDITKLKEIFNIKNLAIFNDEDFNEAISNLPVIARNCLEENKENLWYEEVVPRESIFYTVFNYYDNFNEDGKDKRGRDDKYTFTSQINKFDKKLLNDNIQIGANASIGYGICNFSILGGENE